MWRIVLLFISVMFVATVAWGQADSVAVRLQKIKSITDDSVKLVYADEIPAFLEQIAFGDYSLSAPVQFLGYKKCINEDTELFSWAIPLSRGQAFYNWFRFKEGNRTYLLKSVSGLKEGENSWLYYDLVGFENRKEQYFALLGWSRTRNTNRKIVQIARFEADGTISFNHPLMRRGNSRSASLSFEYARDGSMMLKPDKKGKRIIFDHLAPTEKKYEGYFMFYGADASYDALILKGGEWEYETEAKG